MPRLYAWRALAIGAMLLAASPVTGLAATPAPQPSPSATPAPSCTVPPGLEGDPQEQALATKCKVEQAKIQTEKGKLSDNLSLAQGTSDRLSLSLPFSVWILACSTLHFVARACSCGSPSRPGGTVQLG